MVWVVWMVDGPLLPRITHLTSPHLSPSMQDEWRFDTIPEFMDGKNTMDFFDADIEERLRALEEEEVRTVHLIPRAFPRSSSSLLFTPLLWCCQAQLEANGAYAPEEEDEEDLDEEEMILYEAIKEKQGVARVKNHETKSLVPKVYVCFFFVLPSCFV